jgi:hypothetical protein
MRTGKRNKKRISYCFFFRKEKMPIKYDRIKQILITIPDGNI